MSALSLLIIAAPERTVWAGQAVVVGHRSVPFLGKVEAKTDSRVLAEVTTSADRIVLRQWACAIELSNPLGVRLSLSPGAAERLPQVELIFERGGDGAWYQRPVTSGWLKEDVDGDKSPGMTLNVEAPICGGKLFVGLETTSRSKGKLRPGGGLEGELRVRSKQTMLDTEGACLSVLSKDADEGARGRFVYAPVDPSTTCATLAGKPWPVLLSP